MYADGHVTVIFAREMTHTYSDVILRERCTAAKCTPNNLLRFHCERILEVFFELVSSKFIKINK